MALFGVLPMVPLVILPIGIAIGTNDITNGTVGKTLNDIGIPLVPLGNPEHTQYRRVSECVATVVVVGPSYFWAVPGFSRSPLSCGCFWCLLSTCAARMFDRCQI